MEARPLACILASVALVLSIVPAASASHHAGPPDETGLGPGDVANEPSTPLDKGDAPNNGLEACDPSCTDPNGTLVLDGDYSYGPYPYFVDVNSVLRQTAGEAQAESDEYILPGSAWISAWWGWWADKGRGGYLHETGQTVPGAVSGQPDATVNDGHDNHENHSDTIYTGDWDEFIWRGQNPWAGQTAWDSDLGGKPSHDGEDAPRDQMFAFVNPGTHHNCCTGDSDQATAPPPGFSLDPDVTTLSLGSFPGGGLLLQDADGAKIPDLRVEDRTDQAEASPGPVPHNNQAYGWVSEFGWMHFQYDSSLVMATSITYAVNPPSGDQPGTKDYTDPATTAVDQDQYSAVHPAVEDLYRATVWDPEEGEHEGNNVFAGVVSDEGPKEEAKGRFAGLGENVAELREAGEDTVQPANPTVGVAHDLASKARPHEPDTGDESGYAAAANDDATYGNLAGDPGYYNPDSDASYADHGADFEPWLDGQTWLASAQFLIQLRDFTGFNTYASPAGGDAGDRSAGPSALWTVANLGAWWDASGDTWVGDLGETGRPTDPGSPYADGRVDDPNDYEDTPRNTEANPVKTDQAEFQGAGDASTVTATFCPQGPDEYDPSAGCPSEAAWGETEPPAGVYVLRDADGNNFNPYDDALEDAVGPVGPFADCASIVGDLNCDEDDERLSQHVTHGPVSVEFTPDTTGTDGVFLMQENIVFPTGTLTYPVAVTVDGEIGASEDISRNDGTDLGGSTISDVDYLLPAGG